MDSTSPTPNAPPPEPAGAAPATRESLGAAISALRADLASEGKYDQASDAPDRVAALQKYQELLMQRATLEAAASPEAPTTPDPAASLPFPLTPEAVKDPVTVERVRAFVAAAAELGIAPAEMQSLLSHKPEGDDPEATEAVLREEWGEDYDKNLQAAQLAFARFPAEIQQYIQACGYGSDPYIISRLAKLGKPMAEVRPAYEQIVLELAHPKTRLSEEQEAKLQAEHRRLSKILYGTDFAPGHVRQ